jgi:hypothetical protein
MPLDIVLAGSGLEGEFLDRARLIDIGGARVPIIDAADLIVATILAARRVRPPPTAASFSRS